MVLVKIYVVKEDDNLRRGGKWALKFDARRNRGVTVAYVRTREEFLILGCDSECIKRGIMKKCVIPSFEVAGFVIDRLDTNVSFVVNI